MYFVAIALIPHFDLKQFSFNSMSKQGGDQCVLHSFSRSIFMCVFEHLVIVIRFSSTYADYDNFDKMRITPYIHNLYTCGRTHDKTSQ